MTERLDWRTINVMCGRRLGKNVQKVEQKSLLNEQEGDAGRAQKRQQDDQDKRRTGISVISRCI
jgi:hypothetical protein